MIFLKNHILFSIYTIKVWFFARFLIFLGLIFLSADFFFFFLRGDQIFEGGLGGRSLKLETQKWANLQEDSSKKKIYPALRNFQAHQRLRW